MADFNLVMPKMGESVQEATITKWMVKPGDIVEEDDMLLEIATDKVDTEIPSPVAGKIIKILFPEGAVVPVGNVIAIINTEGEGDVTTDIPADESVNKGESIGTVIPGSGSVSTGTQPGVISKGTSGGKFFSPLVRSIAQKENISIEELNSIQGTGINGRVRKQDILSYLEKRHKEPELPTPSQVVQTEKIAVSLLPGDKIVEMDRMRKLIAAHMVLSKQTAPHVSNFVEADVTNLVRWRNKVKDDFLKKEKQKLTFMPVFIEVTASALKEYPGVNSSVDGNNIILRKNINIGIAVALNTGNLIVPVIKNADQMNLLGLTVELNRLANAARNNALSPDEIQGGTFTISNFGTFGNLSGTPIINQPQAAILATGSIEKKPSVIETPDGDAIAIRHKIILSLSYDHRIIDGALGGIFLRRIADLLEQFDPERII